MIRYSLHEIRKLFTSNDKMRTALGVPTLTTINKLFNDGLTFEQADKFAVRVDKHPIEIWGYDMWMKGLLEDGNIDLQSTH